MSSLFTDNKLAFIAFLASVTGIASNSLAIDCLDKGGKLGDKENKKFYLGVMIAISCAGVAITAPFLAYRLYRYFQ